MEKLWSIDGGRRRSIADYLSSVFPSVEVSVTSTSSTSKGSTVIVAGWHEFPAPVHSVSSNTSSVILLTLPVPHASNRKRWVGAAPRPVISLYHHLTLLHVFPNSFYFFPPCWRERKKERKKERESVILFLKFFYEFAFIFFSYL